MSPSYGFCLWQIPCWCEFSFSLVSLEGFPRKWASPSGSHFGKTKYGDKIAPCGRKKYIPLERKRIGLCGRKNPCSERIYLCIEKDVWCASHFFRLQAIFWNFELYFVFLMSSGRLVWLFTGSPEGSQGNKRTWQQGWLQARPIREDRKKYFYLIFPQKISKL